MNEKKPQQTKPITNVEKKPATTAKPAQSTAQTKGKPATHKGK